MAKQTVYTIESTSYRTGASHKMTGTLEELCQSFSYTLECGHSYQHEKGNSKINTKPKTIKSLITNINNAETNRTANGCASRYFSLI